MKPLVYFDFKEHEQNSEFVVVEKNRLKKILDEVYQAGYDDGYSNKSNLLSTTPTWTIRNMDNDKVTYEATSGYVAPCNKRDIVTNQE